MKTPLIIGGSALAVGGLWAGGAFDRGEVYDLPMPEARSRLEALTLPKEVLAVAGGKDAEFSEDAAGYTLTWKLNSGEGKPAKFSAYLMPEGPARTRVRLYYQTSKSSSSFAQYADKLMSTGFMRSYAESGFHEQVDAALEGRPADQGNAMREFAARAARHPEEVREVGATVSGILDDVAGQAAEGMKAEAEWRRAERDQARMPPQRSAQESMSAATRPSVDLKRN